MVSDKRFQFLRTLVVPPLVLTGVMGCACGSKSPLIGVDVPAVLTLLAVLLAVLALLAVLRHGDGGSDCNGDETCDECAFFGVIAKQT
jgi:hypothetical protein